MSKENGQAITTEGTRQRWHRIPVDVEFDQEINCWEAKVLLAEFFAAHGGGVIKADYTEVTGQVVAVRLYPRVMQHVREGRTKGY